MANETVVHFSNQYDIGGESVGQLTMREPTVADQLRVKKTGKRASTEEQELLLFSFLTSAPVKDLEQLTLADYSELQQAFLDYLSPSENET